MYNIDYRYLRPKKAEATKRIHALPFKKRETLDIWTGKNATILPLRTADQFDWTGNGGVVDSNGSYVDISSTYTFVNNAYPFDHPDFRDLKVVYCGYLVQHWGHFLVDAVSRLWYFLENDSSIDKYVFIVKEGEIREIKGNYKEFFSLLKIWDKLEIINTPTTYREVIVPELGFQRGKYYSPKFLNIYNTVAENICIDPSWKSISKIYWSRSQLNRSNSSEFGFDAADNYFRKNGYTVMYPERIPLSEMIFYIRNADTIAAVSGSLPHNLFFGKQGQKLEILERCTFVNDWQVYVNRMKELQVTYIDGHISLYPVSMYGPFMMGYNDIMERFTVDNGYLPPDDCFLSKKHFRSCFTKYMKAYKDIYRYQWFIEDYLFSEIDYHAEAYEYGRSFYMDYLNGSRPFLWHHYFELHYWKQAIKRLLNVSR